MSYQVLARKWRPKQFSEMVGQGHVLKALVNALDDNRLHHAYLFTGTRGVGKTSIARLFAKALNCEQGITSKPCGECSACQEIAEGRFVDLIEVDAASRTKVEDTRELLENVQYAPSRGRFKVYLIDEVHMLSKSSFNALLKTLEEPPPHVKFLLATTDPQKLPVTVLSRCLQFNLKNMIPQRIVEHLSTVLSAEQIPFEEAALWLLARSADGSMRDALSLTDQSIAFGAGSVCEADVRVMLGTIDLQFVYEILDALVQGDGVALLKCVENLAQFSPDYNTVLGDIVSLLHRIAIAQTVPAALDNSMGDKQQVEALAAKLTGEDVQLYYQIALMGRKDLPFVPDAREGLEMTLMRMLAFRPAHSANLKPVLLQETETKAQENISIASPESEVTSAQVMELAPAIEAPAVGVALVGDVVAEPEIAPQAIDNSSVSATASEKKNTAEIGLLAGEPAVAPPLEKAPELQRFERAQAVSEQVVPVSSDESEPLVSISESVVSDLSTVTKQTPALSNQRVVSAPPQVSAEPPVVSAKVVDLDIPPWEDEQSYQQSVASKPSVAVAEINAQPESVSSQIDVSKMLAAPVTEFAQLSLDDWPALVGYIGFSGMTAHIAENLSLESIEGSKIQFNVSQVQKNVLDQTQKDRLQAMLAAYFKCDLEVGYESEKSTRETPWQCFEKLRAKRLRQAIANFQADEMVQQLVSVFSGDIERSSIMPIN